MALLASALISSCGGSGGSLTQGVRSWTSMSGFSGTVSTLTGDISRIHTARERNDLLGMRTECSVFVADVRTALGELPTPDTTLTKDLSTAYNDYAQSATDCYEARSLEDQARLARSEKLLQSGTSYLTKARARILDVTES